MPEDTTYDLTNLPEDAEIFNTKQEFAPIDPAQPYQVEISNVELRNNPFYKEDEKANGGSKYQFSFEFIILDEGEYYGRRLWDTSSLAFKPEGKKGPTKLYKIITAALHKNLSWEEVAEYSPTIKAFYANLRSLIGQQVKVLIENTTTKTGKPRSKILSYLQVKGELPHYDPDQKSSESKKEKKGKKNADDIPF